MDGFFHKVTTIVSCQKNSCSHGIFLDHFPNSHLEKSYKEVWCVFSLITSIGSWQAVLVVDNGKSSHWLGVRDLTQLKSCMLYPEIKAEFRNQGSNQIGYGCSYLRSGTREIQSVMSVYICTIISKFKQQLQTVRNHKLIPDSNMLQILIERNTSFKIKRWKVHQRFGSPGCHTSGSLWIWRLKLCSNKFMS